MSLQVQWLDYKVHKREWKRVKLSLCEESNDRLLRRMSKNNSDLETLLGQSLRLELARHTPKSTSHAKHFERVRNHALAIHNALRHGFTQGCGCVAPHYANLELEARTLGLRPADDQAVPDLDALAFHVLCCFETISTPQEPLPWNWQEAMIEPLGDSASEPMSPPYEHPADNPSDVHTVQSALLTVPLNPTNHLSKALNALPIRKKRSKVSFSLPDNSRLSMSASAATSTSLLVAKPSPTELQEFEDLCGAIHQRAREISCLGVLIDQEANKHRVSLRDGNLPSSPSLKIVSLKKLLSQALKIAKRDRLILGVKLASSVLQLHKTPWLKEVWSKSDIFFVQNDEQSSTIIITKPFVSKAFQSPVCKMSARVSTDPYTNPAPDVRNQTIFSLGIVLIELWFGQTLETLRIPEDLGANNTPNQLTDFATARRLTEEIYNEAGEWYGDAVRRCIYCEFDQRNTSLEAEGMKEAVFSGVVSPLHENLTSFCGGQLHDVLK